MSELTWREMHEFAIEQQVVFMESMRQLAQLKAKLGIPCEKCNDNNPKA